MGFWQVCGVAPLPSRTFFGFPYGQVSRELLGQQADGNDVEPLGLVGLEVVGDAKDGRIDDIEACLFFDLPNGCGLEGLPSLKVASRNREIWSMGAFPLADEDMACGVYQDDSDADVGAGAGGGGHYGDSLAGG